MRKYLFTILLCLTLIPTLPGIWKKIYIESTSWYEPSHREPAASGEPDAISPDELLPPDDSSQNCSEISSDDSGDIQNSQISTEPAIKEFTTVDLSYWDDALFIGDSRTVGLSEYADLGGADVLANSGMSVYKVFTEKFTLHGKKKETLEEILAQRQYGKIYIMLGINELGYRFEQTIERYSEMLSKIQELQPDAIIFLGANLHVTEEKSNADTIFNNPNINRINESISAFADQQTIFYVDVNPLFDDEGGNLTKEYTGDEAHILGKYYADWAAWLLTMGIE